MQHRFSGARTVAACLIAAVVGSAATAGAASLITGKQIKDGSITAKDLSAAVRKELGKTGAPGLTGPAGATGKDGAPGKDGTNGSPDTATQVRDKLLTVDGPGSGVNADVLDGRESSTFAPVGSDLHALGSDGSIWDGGYNEACTWSNYGSGFTPAAFIRDSAGFVHLQGQVKASDNPAVIGGCTDTAVNSLYQYIAQLPVGYRPAGTELFAAMMNEKLLRMDITSDGRIATNAGTTRPTAADLKAWVSLSGITFRCAPSGQDGCP